MITQNKQVSYSQYKMWISCPYQWKLSYVDGLRESTPSINTLFGNAMHTVIQEWLQKYVFGGSRDSVKRVDLSDWLKLEMIAEFKKSTQEEDGVKTFVCDKNELMEFHDDGCQILLYLQENASKFFDEEWHLEGIELPLELEIRNGVGFIGYLDIVLRHKLTGMIRIIDLKTSGYGWNKWAKADKTRTNQLLLYKKFYAQQYDISEDYVDVEFIILRRKINEDALYPQHRVTKFAPPNKSPSIKKATVSLDEFLDACIDADGEYITEGHDATPSKSSCRFCSFRKQPEICDKSEWKDD